ncbi:MAG: hypothetical protein JWQ44_2299 [Chthoniobacter sp.]|nr:hypothetical protein [Chthoniobacter sp.]
MQAKGRPENRKNDAETGERERRATREVAQARVDRKAENDRGQQDFTAPNRERSTGRADRDDSRPAMTAARRKAEQSERRQQDLAANIRERDGRDRTERPERPDLGDRSKRDERRDRANESDRLNRDGRPDRDRTLRNRQDVDRRPPRTDSEDERQRRIARAQVKKEVERDRKRQVAQRKERSGDRVEKFRENRKDRVASLHNRRQALRAARANVRRENVRESREEIREYWKDRADDVRDRVEDRRENLFDDDWWENRRWRNRPVAVSNPWWWWQPARWDTVNVFLDAGWSEPVDYDYGTDVIYDEREVYVRGESIGTPVEYSRSVIRLANPDLEAIAEAPVVEHEWTPLGVWALVQEEQGDAVMFFQLSVNKNGVISGAYVNVVSGEELPVVGQVDRTTQRAAWHIGEQTEKVFEAGMTNLTQDQASCLVHLAPGEMQPWLLVRMEGPELPTQPAAVR